MSPKKKETAEEKSAKKAVKKHAEPKQVKITPPNKKKQLLLQL
jgi:hypothetical protein